MDQKKSAVYQEILFYGIAAILMGILVGALDALFGEVLILITQFRGQHIALLLPFLAVAGRPGRSSAARAAGVRAMTLPRRVRRALENQLQTAVADLNRQLLALTNRRYLLSLMLT